VLPASAPEDLERVRQAQQKRTEAYANLLIKSGNAKDRLTLDAVVSAAYDLQYAGHHNIWSRHQRPLSHVPKTYFARWSSGT
jgi:hypothetical protein